MAYFYVKDGVSQQVPDFFDALDLVKLHGGSAYRDNALLAIKGPRKTNDLGPKVHIPKREDRMSYKAALR